MTGNYNNASGTVHDAIAKANPDRRYAVQRTYDGDPHTATGTAKGVKGENLSGLNLSGTTHTNAGDYPSDAWTFTDVTGNYNNASGTVHHAIAKANAAIVVTPYSAALRRRSAHCNRNSEGSKGREPQRTRICPAPPIRALEHYPSDAWTFTDVTGNYNNSSWNRA